jgi:hypothetical protein
VHDIEAKLGSVSFDRGYHYELLGGYRERQSAESSLLTNAVMALVAILLLRIAFQFWRPAVFTLLTLPMALIGGAIAIYLIGGDVSIGALVGLPSPNRDGPASESSRAVDQPPQFLQAAGAADGPGLDEGVAGGRPLAPPPTLALEPPKKIIEVTAGDSGATDAPVAQRHPQSTRMGQHRPASRQAGKPACREPACRTVRLGPASELVGFVPDTRSALWCARPNSTPEPTSQVVIMHVRAAQGWRERA